MGSLHEKTPAHPMPAAFNCVHPGSKKHDKTHVAVRFNVHFGGYTGLVKKEGPRPERSDPVRSKGKALAQTARVTLPERRQRVQAYTRLGDPSTIALTRLTLGFHVLLERLWEWETLIPKVTLFPQNSHFAMMRHLLHDCDFKAYMRDDSQ